MNISRRNMLGSLGAGVFFVRGYAQTKPQPLFVLVHGAWHGGWCWHKVTPLLRTRGAADVFTPTLTGLGDRRHLANASVGLQTHVDDVCGLLEAEDLREVVLVGHSYGGMVISGVAAKLRSRLRQLVYLDAFIAEPGRSLQDAAPNFPFQAIATKSGEGWRVPMSAVFSIPALGVKDPADVAWIEPRIADQSVKTFTDPSAITPDTLKSVPCSFILASPAFARFSEIAKQRSWPVRQMDGAGHDAMVTQPRELAEILFGLLA